MPHCFLLLTTTPPTPLPAGMACLPAGARQLCFPATAWQHEHLIVQCVGHLFGAADTAPAATLAALYERHGEALPEHLDGDGAWLLYDRRRDLLLAGNDRFRIHDLYYAELPGGLAVATSCAALLALGVPRTMNARQHALYLGSNYRRFGDLCGETYYQQIRRLPFAGRLRHDARGLRVDQYWDLALTNLAHVAAADLGADYVAKLGASVRRRLATCRNPAFTISSGMDSSSVVCLAAEQLGRQVPLYTTTYREETDYNEAEDIAVMARQFGSQWHQVLVTGDTILATLRTCLADADEPYATVTQLMHDYLARQARADGYDALFSGLGGDEANAGEIEEYLFFFADLQARGETAALRAHMVGWHAYHDHPLYPKNEAVLQRFFAQQIDFTRPGHNLPNPAYHQSYRAALRAPPELPPPHMPHPYRSYLRNKLYQDLFYETIPPVLKAETANSRRAGLPTLYPYLDPAVMATGFSIPLALKYDRGISKALLRQAMRGRLPDAVLDNCRKRGWNAPFNLWVTQSLTPLVEDFIHRPTDRQRDLYDTTAIARYWHEHRANQHNHMMFFWQLINYELWYAQQPA